MKILLFAQQPETQYRHRFYIEYVNIKSSGRFINLSGRINKSSERFKIICLDNLLIRPDDLIICADGLINCPDKLLNRPDGLINRSTMSARGLRSSRLYTRYVFVAVVLVYVMK